MKEKLPGITGQVSSQSESFPKPEAYDTWNTPETAFKREAWDKFPVFHERVRAAESIPEIITALEDYAVTDPNIEVENIASASVVEWIPFGTTPDFDYTVRLDNVVDTLKDMEENGPAKYLSPDQTHISFDITPVAWRLEELFQVRPPAEDEVIAKLHDFGGEGGKEKRKRALQLHHDAERTVTGSLFEKYATGELPTIEMLERGALLAADATATEIQAERDAGTAESDLEDEIRIEKILRGRPKVIADGVRSYIRTVLRFQRLNKLRKMGRDVLKQFEQTDHQRRRAHNALLDSLRTYTEAVYEAKSLGLLEEVPVVLWESEDSLKGEMPDRAIVIFSERVIGNRDYIRDWAIVAEMNERLKDIDELDE